MAPPGTAHVCLVRSPYAHARITDLDLTSARAMPGVLVVVTADDLPPLASIPAALPGGRPVPEHPALARGLVRFAGEPVVAVVAERPELAMDAATVVAIEYEPLPAVVDGPAALESTSPLVHEGLGTNEAFCVQRTSGDVDAAFRTADRVVDVRVKHARVAAIPIEPRGVLAWVDGETGRLTVNLGTQAAWLERTDLATVLGLAEDDLRIVTPDVGGAFGAKMTLYREDVIVAGLARQLGRPVRWMSTRVEDLQASMHGREAVSQGQVAVRKDGRMLGLRVRSVANLGAYLMKYGAGPVQRMTVFPTGTYAIEHLDAVAIGALTHTAPTGPYRGAGRPEAAFFAERMADEVAFALGLDPAEVRRRNFIPRDAFPYTTAGGVSYDSGDYAASLEEALERVDYSKLRRQQAERRARGELVGIGIASTVEVSGGGAEGGEVTIDETGAITAITGASPHGQGHITTFAQLIADQLGVEPARVKITFGDTDSGPRGGGTMGSRSGTLGGNAIQVAAATVRARLLEAAGGLLEAAQEDLLLEDGTVSVRGVPARRVSFGDVVVSLGGGPVTSRSSFSAEGGDTFPFGATVAVVSIDRETGRVRIEQFVAVDDCGKVLNPVIVEGQLHGGIAQGIGEALLEEVRYDAAGGLITGSLSDYAVPTAAAIPYLDLSRTETPSPRNPLGMKGVGESGTVSAPPAIANAVLDAVRPEGVTDLELPMTADRIWRALHGARGG
ncbi:MAG: xanthine dehydrogenase family protein molybdopterin-binding subunit [Chloroflexota bacterium]|nr:xanthine dehydrogenase family protein molybdopterin-binding subunit [Chloroflexota bacterium]